MLSRPDQEQCVLGTILVYPRQASPLVEALELDDFDDPRNRYIFKAIENIYEDGNIPSPQLIFAHVMSATAKWESLRPYISEIMGQATTLHSVKGIVLTLKDATARRKVVEICKGATEMAMAHEASVDEALAYALSAFDGVACNANISKPVSLKKGIGDLIGAIRKGVKDDGIASGFSTIDRWFGGFHRRETTVIAGRPSMGKSSLLFCIANQAAKKGANVLLFSLEMPLNPVVARMTSDLIWNRTNPIPYEKIIKADLTEFELERISAISVADNLIIDDRPWLSAHEIAARARSINDTLKAKGERLDLVLVDHLGRVKASDRYAGQKVHETGEKINAMTTLSKTQNVSVIVAHQISRANESRDNKRPGLSDLRDSGDMEQDADNVLFVYRPAYYLERMKEDGDGDHERRQKLEEKKNALEVIVAKCRNGKCGTMDFYCDMASNVVRDKW